MAKYIEIEEFDNNTKNENKIIIRYGVIGDTVIKMK